MRTRGSETSLVTNYETDAIWVKGERVVKSRNLETMCNSRCGHNLSRCGLLANIAYLTGHRLTRDDTMSGSSAIRKQTST